MKLLLFLVMACGAMAQTKSLEEVAPHFSTNATITWAVSNNVPERLWVYRRLPATFSAAVMSNAFLIANFDLKEFPKLWEKGVSLSGPTANGDMRPDYLVIEPKRAEILCRRERNPVGFGKVSRDALTERAFGFARLLGVDRKLIVTNWPATNAVSFSRVVDGDPVWEDAEGFGVTFGERGEMLDFNLSWPRLEAFEFAPTASRHQVTQCIRKFKTVIMPRHDEESYFERVTSYKKATAVVITNSTIYYGEEEFGQQPEDDDGRDRFLRPLLKLQGTVKLEGTNDPVEIAAPILVADVERLFAETRWCRLVLMTANERFTKSEAVKVSVVVTNRAATNAVIPTAMVGAGIDFLVTDASGLQVNRRSDGHGIAFSGPSSLEIPAHRAITNTVDLRRYYVLKPGVYSVRATREMRLDPSVGSEVLISAPVRIVIR